MKKSRPILLSFVLFSFLCLPCSAFLVAITTASEGKAIKTQTVVASGIGLTETSAIQTAARAAVQQVVGMYLVSETIVKNSQVLKDEIFSQSNGFVKAFRVLSKRKTEDGLFEVEAEVEVETGKVVKKLEDLNIATKDIQETDQFIAKAFDKRSGAKDLKAMVEKIVLQPIKANKKVWDINIESFHQLDEFDDSVTFAGDDRIRFENFEMTPFRVVFSVGLNKDYYDGINKLFQHAAKEIIPYYQKPTNNKEFYVYIADIDKVGNRVASKIRKTYRFTSTNARVMKHLLGIGIGQGQLEGMCSLLRMSLLDKAGHTGKTAFYFGAGGQSSLNISSGSYAPVSDLSGSSYLQMLYSKYGNDPEKWQQFSSNYIEGERFDETDILLGIDRGYGGLYVLSNSVKFSAVLYLSEGDITELKSIELELKAMFI